MFKTTYSLKSNHWWITASESCGGALKIAFLDITVVLWNRNNTYAHWSLKTVAFKFSVQESIVFCNPKEWVGVCDNVMYITVY